MSAPSTTTYIGMNRWSDFFGYAAAVTPHDSNPVAPVPIRALYVGGTGNVEFIWAGDGATVTLFGVVAGTILNVVATHVRDAGTTATNLVALW